MKPIILKVQMFIVTSTAIHDDNPEVIAAHSKRIPVVPRAQMLAELMRERTGNCCR